MENDLIFEISEIFKNNKHTNQYVHVYPKCVYSSGVCTPKKFTPNDIHSIKTKLNLQETDYIDQEEEYYRDLVKIRTGKITMYAKKMTMGQVLNDNLVVVTIFEKIDEEQFPTVQKNHYECKKVVQIYDLDLVNLIIVNNEIICLQIKKRPMKSDEKKNLRKQINYISTVLD